MTGIHSMGSGDTFLPGTRVRGTFVRGTYVPAVNEVRVVNEATGGEKGRKPAQLGAVDPLSLLEVAEVAGFGGDKYERYNFAKGYDWSLSFDAMMRHVLAFWGGETADPESGLPHMAHAAWHCLTLLTFARRYPQFDDRFPA